MDLLEARRCLAVLGAARIRGRHRLVDIVVTQAQQHFSDGTLPDGVGLLLWQQRPNTLIPKQQTDFTIEGCCYEGCIKQLCITFVSVGWLTDYE